MTGRRDDMSNSESRKVPGLTEDHSVPYEYPAIDEKPSYWAGRWAEFKRIWRLSWKPPETRITMALSVIMIGVGLIMTYFESYS